MSWLRRREIPIAITFIVGMIAIVEYFFKIRELTAVSVEIQAWAVTFAAFSLALGTIALLYYHGRHVIRRTPGQWYFSVWLIICLFLMLITALGGPSLAAAYKFVYGYLYSMPGGMVYGLSAFFSAGAAYRAFKARRAESALLLIAGALVMLWNAPIGSSIWSGFTPIGDWIMTVPNTAGTRGFMIVAAVGAVAIGLRILIGRERGAVGE